MTTTSDHGDTLQAAHARNAGAGIRTGGRDLDGMVGALHAGATRIPPKDFTRAVAQRALRTIGGRTVFAVSAGARLDRFSTGELTQDHGAADRSLPVR